MTERTGTNPEALRKAVQEKYASIAPGETDGCCGSDTPDGPEKSTYLANMIGDAYGDVAGYVADADLELGCGVPTEHAGLEPAQTVVDLGSGAGLDSFVTRRIVGETGRVIGVDFVPEMVQKARANAEELGYENVDFVEGAIEDLPLESEIADVVLSNCVFNLVPEKARAFAETNRILRPGGHFCISDIVSRGTLPDPVRKAAELHAVCVSGAIDRADYLRLIDSTGFEGVEIAAERPISLPDELLRSVLENDELSEFRNSVGELRSVTVRAKKPLA